LGAALQADGENEVRGYGLKHQKEKRSMDHFAGLDVSVKETSVCILDDAGKIVKEVKVASWVTSDAPCKRRRPIDFRYAPLATDVVLRCNRSRWAKSRHQFDFDGEDSRTL
jgi:hypothetical protein